MSEVYNPDYPEDVDVEERKFRDKLRLKIAQYFQERVQSDPTITGEGKLRSFWGQYQDGERTINLCKPVMKPNIWMPQGIPLGSLNARLYAVGYGYPGGLHTAVFAVYDDETLLWLDNHISNREFEIFWQREAIDWRNADEAATFMVHTKFHYLPAPSGISIVSAITDIPQDHYRSFLEAENLIEDLREYEQKLAGIAPHLHPPLMTKSNQVIQLQFFVWLRAGGTVLKISCRFEANGSLSYSGTILDSWVGEAFAPR